MKQFTILLFISVLFSQISLAQDTIVKRNNTVLIGRITEITLEEVKYRPAGQENGPILSVDRNDILKIIFQNGTTQTFMPTLDNPENYESNNKNALKVDFLAPLFYKTVISYERSLKPGISSEVTVGIIGAGYNSDNTRTASGAFVKFGMKFIKSPDFYVKGLRYAHVLKGSYIKPEVFFGAFKTTFTQYDYLIFPYVGATEHKVTKNISNFGLQLLFGKQWVVNNVFCCDIYGGLGYCFDNTKRDPNQYFDDTQYTVQKFSNNSPFSVSGGLKVGFLFK